MIYEIRNNEVLIKLIRESANFVNDSKIVVFAASDSYREKIENVLKFAANRNYLTDRQINYLERTLDRYYLIKKRNLVLDNEFKREYSYVAESIIENESFFEEMYLIAKQQPENKCLKEKIRSLTSRRANIRTEKEAIELRAAYFVEETFNRILCIIEPDKLHGDSFGIDLKFKDNYPIINFLKHHFPNLDELKKKTEELSSRYRKI